MTRLPEKSVSAWWLANGAMLIIYFILSHANDGKTGASILAGGLCLCLAAVARLRSGVLRRIADTALLAYSISFALIIYLVYSLFSDKSPLMTAALVTVAAVNMIVSLLSLFRKKDKD